MLTKYIIRNKTSHSSLAVQKLNRLFALLVLLTLGIQLHAQVDNLHYIPPFYAPPFNNFTDVGPTNNPAGNYFHRVVLSTSVEDTFDVNIRTKTDFVATVQISKATPAYVDLPTYAYYSTYDDATYNLPKTVVSQDDINKVLNNQGLILEADYDFYVNISQRSGAQGDLLTSKGRVGKGTHFFSGHLPNKVLTSTQYRPRRSNFISVMATEDNTEITFSNPRLRWYGHAQNTFTITLQKEETYVLGAWLELYNTSDNPDDLIGTEITSTKDIVVNTGSWCGSLADGNSQDIGIDQLVPVEILGNEFITVRGEGTHPTNHSEKVIVVSPYDDNTIVVNGGTTQVTLDKGEYFMFDADDYNANQNIYLNSTYGTYVYQSLLGAAGSNPTVGFIFIPKLSCEGYKDVSISYTNSIGNPQLLLVARKGSGGDLPVVTIDGVKIDSALATTGSAVTGNSDWVTYKIGPTAIANHFNADGDWHLSVESNYAINAALSFESGVIGGGGFYSGFGIRPAIQTAPRILNTNGCAPGNMELQADDSYYNTYQWYKDGVEIAGATNSVYYPTTRGVYTLKGLTDCGLSRESAEVNVRTCIYWESKDGDGMDVDIWEDATALSPPEDPFVFLEFRLAEALDFDIFIRYRTIIPSYLPYPATPGIGGDFIPIDYNAQIHIPADSISGFTDPMWILPDFIDEQNEQFNIEIIDVLDVDGNVGAIVQDDQVTVTILDDDSITTTVNIEDDFSVIENEGNAVFTISLTEASGRAVYVDYKTVANTAFSSNDYYSRSGTLTFLEGETQKTVSVPIINRNGFNGERNFHVVLENPTYCLLGNDTSTCTIQDKEGEDVFLYYVNDTSSVEGDSLYFDIRLSQSLLEPLSFRLALLEGTATSDDFGANSIDSTTLTANVGVLDAGQNPVSQLSYNEGVGNGEFYVQLSNVMDVPVTVIYQTTANTAEENLDYLPINNMLLFMPGDSIKKLEIPILDDERKEPVENFLFQITKVVNGYNSQSIWEVHITDNEAIPTLSLENDKSMLEDEGAARFKVSLSQKSNDTIKVTYSAYEYDILTDAPATAGDGSLPQHDFRSLTDILTFLPGDSVKYTNVDVFLNDGGGFGFSYADEAAEKFYVSLVSVEDANTGSINPAANRSIATIHEEEVFDTLHHIYLEEDVWAEEGQDLTFAVKRFTGTINAWRVQVAFTPLSASAADFSSTPSTAFIDLPAGSTSANLTISTVDDNLLEADENFTLQIVDAQYKETAVDPWTTMDILPGRATVYGVIQDNDLNDAPIAHADSFYVGTNQTLTITDNHGVLENDIIYTTNDVNTVSWNGAINPAYGTLTALGVNGSFTYVPATDYQGNFTMNYTLQTTKGDAVVGSVYFSVVEMPTRYFITPGDTVFQISIPTVDDAREEADEQFTMTAFDLSSTSVRILPGRNTSTGTIVDDDFYPLATNDYFYVNEDNALYPPSANVLLNDVVSPLDTVTEIVLDTIGAYLLHGSLIVDMALDGTFTYMPDPGYSGRDSFVYTIRDTRTDSLYTPAQAYDEATAVVIIDIIPTNDVPVAIDDAYTLDEDDSGTLLELTANDLDPDNVGLTITSVWGNTLGTVQMVSDSTILYDPIWFGTDTLFYRLDDLDTFDDPDTGMVVITIAGEIDRYFSVLQNENILETNADPSGTMTFTVTLNQASYKTRTVNYRTVAISGNSVEGTDFVATSGTLTFNAGTTQQTADVTVMGRGISDNYDHRFTFELYDASVGTYLGTEKSASGTIINVEPDERYLIINNDLTVIEGDTAIFTVTLVGDPLPYDLPFSASTSDGTAVGSLDYEDSTFVAGSGFIKPDLTMSSASGSFTVNEGAGSITINFDLSAATTADVSFSYEIHNAGSATAINEEDYIADYRFAKIPAGQTQYSITIPILDDEMDEEDETFYIDLANPINVTLTNPTEIITIQDNDDPPVITLAGDKGVLESEGILRYPVNLSRASGKTITVELTAEESSPRSARRNGGSNNTDFESKTETLIFAPGDTVKYFEVTIRNNWNQESDEETFEINAASPVNATIGNPGSGTITIYDTGASDIIYFGGDVMVENGNNKSFSVSVTSNTWAAGFGFLYRYKVAITGEHAAILKPWAGNYPAITSNSWIYSSDQVTSIVFETGASVTNMPTQTFQLEITEAEYGWGNSGWFNYLGDINILNGAHLATVTITNEVNTRFVQKNSYVIHPGETLNSNFLSNDNMVNLNINSINFIPITSAYWPYDHEDNLTLGTNGSISYTPPTHDQTGENFYGDFVFIAQIQGNDPTNYNSYHEYNDTITIYVVEEPEEESGGSNLPTSSGITYLRVPTIDDVLDEAEEDFYITLSLSDTSVVKLRTGTTARAVIVDNDDTPATLLFPDITSCYEQQPVTVNVLANDDPDGLYNLTVTAVSDPPNGSIVAFDGNGNITYKPDIFFVGSDNFTYTVTSDQGLTYPMTVAVQVQSIEDLENKRSLYCPNASSYLTYTPTAAFDANTFEVWIKPVGNASGGIANLGGGKTITRNGAGNVVLSGFTGTVYVDGVAANTLANDTWQHLFVTSSSSFSVSTVQIGTNGSTGMQAYYDELRLWSKVMNSASSVTQLMFQELYYRDGSGQLESLINGSSLFNPAYAGWADLKFHAKFNSTDFSDVIGWSAVTVTGSANISVDLPFNHFMSTAINNDWDWAGNWHFGKDYPNALSPEYIILNPAGSNNPYLHLSAAYSVNSQTTINNLVVLQNADFTVNKGVLKIKGNIFRSPNNRVVYMRGADGIRISKSINISY